jgi:4-amino-4-deoxy-L-arabinose transferase-like glycosyltransferase
VVALLAIVVVALGVRVAYVVAEKWDEPLVGDQIFYNAAANRLAEGEGFVVPFDPENPLEPGTEPAGEHPPLTILVLAPVSWLAGPDPDWHRLTMAVLGAVTVGLIGLLGRAVAGDRAGLLAAGFAALYPNLWVNDGLVMSETLSTLAVVGALLFAYRQLRDPGALVAAGLGACCGLATLARAELLLLAPLLLVPAVLYSRRSNRLEGVHEIVISLVAVLVIVGPWVVFNLGRFDEPTFLSTNDGPALLGSNCDEVYYGGGMGLWNLDCLTPVEGDQSVASNEHREQALRYAREHLERVPVVALARVGRTWSFFRPGDMISYNEGEAREPWVTRVGLWVYYPLFALAVAGAIVLRRQLARLWPLLVPIVVVTIVSAITYGQTRFRAPAEPSLVVLAAVALDAFLPGTVASRRASTGARRAERVTTG